MKGIDGISTHMKNLCTDIIKGDIMKAQIKKSYLQTPEEAFWGKLPEENIQGNFNRNFGGKLIMER